ncbi:MAG TPA: response regulator [Burkholderiales bacterium]|nr:response regulator [Burkholderiales bacterium]
MLVVDDDPAMREMLRVHLCNAGYLVSMAEDAVEAGRLMLAMTPDLLIIDVEMPYLDGVEFVRAMRSEAAFASIPVLMISANDEHARHAASLECRFLPKPILKDTLLQWVSDALASEG